MFYQANDNVLLEKYIVPHSFLAYLHYLARELISSFISCSFSQLIILFC